MIVYLELDDFTEHNNRLDWLYMLKREFPKFKVSVFAITAGCSWAFVEYIKYLSWIELCMHGWKHEHNENVLEANLKEFTKDTFAKIYRAPFWELSDKMYERLKRLGFKIMLHPDDPREGIKYNWNIKDSPPYREILFGHGHIQDVCGNGLVESFENIMKLPKDTEFRFMSDIGKE